MSNQESTCHYDPRKTSLRSGGFPWVPILATVGVAAAALILFKRFSALDEAPSLESALDACDRAANSLEARLHSTNGSLV